MTHWGSRVGDGVKVNVGRGVSDGGTVGVLVGKMIGVTVATWVGEGDNVGVEVGASVGVGETIRPNPPQATSKRAKVDIAIRKFRITQSPRAECYAIEA
jgi:hypothetical protein